MWWRMRGFGRTDDIDTDELLVALGDDDCRVASLAARELGRRPSEALRAAVPLTAALKRGVEGAEASLSGFGMAAMSALTEGYYDGERNEAIGRLLLELASREGGMEAALALMFIEKNPSERRFALMDTVLSRLDPVSETIAALQSRNLCVRLGAIELLGSIAPPGDERTLRELTQMLGRLDRSLEDWPLRRTIARLRGEPEPHLILFVD